LGIATAGAWKALFHYDPSIGCLPLIHTPQIVQET
jgi:hypothetical protein